MSENCSPAGPCSPPTKEDRLMANLREISDNDFETEVLQAAEPVLVDFWAPWCAPCRAIAPILEQLASENGGALKVVKINVDECPYVATNYQIGNIPTVMLFKNGQVFERFIGVQPKHRLQEAISQAVA
jgi:thioredoxin 1